MKTIRKILVRLFGLEGYLRLISRIYIRCISLGLMRKKYRELYFIRQLVQPGDHVLDIGANLAYYSFFMMKSAGRSGRLLAIEPVPLFAKVWQKNMKKWTAYNFQLVNCAVGNEEREAVKMSIPVVDGVIRHGLTSVDTSGAAAGNDALSFSVPMKNGDRLMTDLLVEQLHFIKCDVEGFEQYVIPSLEQTIKQFYPVLQIELSGRENRQAVFDLLIQWGYGAFILQGDFLHALAKSDMFSVNQDFYFIHPTRKQPYAHLIKP